MDYTFDKYAEDERMYDEEPANITNRAKKDLLRRISLLETESERLRDRLQQLEAYIADQEIDKLLGEL
jgi:uncharacterized protein YaaN involved in tellurite resistance